MKRMLTYLIIAVLVIAAAFFVYKKMYGSGMFENKQYNKPLIMPGVAAAEGVAEHKNAMLGY